MIFYCDSLSWPSFKKIIKLLILPEFSKKRLDLRVLDPLPSGWKARIFLWLLSRRVEVREENFNLGKLSMPDGQPIYIAARRYTHEVALTATQRLLDRSPLLCQFNEKWGRKTIMLYLAKQLWPSVNKIIIRILVAETLLSQLGEKGNLIISIPIYLDKDLFSAFSTRLVLNNYRVGLGYEILKQIYGILWIVRQKCLEVLWFVENSLKKRTNLILRNNGKPSLLTLHEDQILSDRSYRTQPHWLDPIDPPPSFRTLILKTSIHKKNREIEDSQFLEDVQIIPLTEWCFPDCSREHLPIEDQLSEDLMACLRGSILGDNHEKVLMSSMVKLFYIAKNLVSFCVKNRVKAFMTCENYMVYSDAMQLIASPLGIRTLSYQYSNIDMVGPYMLTTADLMITFSPIFHERWIQKKSGIRPGCFFDAGYVYDSSFKYLEERARKHRKKIKDAGAHFIICYFDENAFDGKYEMVSKKDLKEEIQILMEKIIKDSTLGLIIKNQFQWNAVSEFQELACLRKKALSTGRYIELSHGIVRNIVFPAEAALASDIAIGHIVGATAPLEAALSGTRTILLNPYGMKNKNDIFYEKANIVCPTIVEALKVIDEIRDGKLISPPIGDWSAILQYFDPYQDGHSALRLRGLLEEIISIDSIN